MVDETTRPGYYAVIPATVRYDDRLRANGKLLYAEITALATKDGYCWADNGFFAANFGVTERCVQKLLAQLAEYGYITLETVQKGNGHQPEKRKIWVQEAAICSRINVRQQDGGGEQKIRGGEQKIAANMYNNKSNNPPLPPKGDACGDNGVFKAERFDGFWKFYKSVVPAGHPVGDKRRAAKAWDKLKPTDAEIAAMGEALKRAARGGDWQRGIGIPHASTWLNQRRWESQGETGTAGETPAREEALGWD